MPKLDECISLYNNDVLFKEASSYKINQLSVDSYNGVAKQFDSLCFYLTRKRFLLVRQINNASLIPPPFCFNGSL